MELITKAPRGTKDVLPSDSAKWQYVERMLSKTAENYGFLNVRFPTFEHSELFNRGIGDGTDVVQKEMYTFSDKGGRSITLRPEGTAGAVRLMLENGLYGGLLPVKMYYIAQCFRYEKPQSGRFREFFQFGVEMFGVSTPIADAEIISLADGIFKAFGIDGISLNINSIGCHECRGEYVNALKKFFADRQDKLCGTCLERLEKNPMRILDCKCPTCKEAAVGAPSMLDYLCGGCKSDFEALKSILDTLKIGYTVNPSIVRGLDYYNGIVFEFISSAIGAQGTVLAGGRYDGLAKQLSGESVAGIGFAMGLERLIMLLEACGKLDDIGSPKPDIYIASIGEKSDVSALKLAGELRAQDIIAVCDLAGKSLKAQMKYADKIGALFTAVLGGDEIAAGRAAVKNMATGETVTLSFNEISDYLKRK